MFAGRDAGSALFVFFARRHPADRLGAVKVSIRVQPFTVPYSLIIDPGYIAPLPWSLDSVSATVFILWAKAGYAYDTATTFDICPAS